MRKSSRNLKFGAQFQGCHYRLPPLNYSYLTVISIEELNSLGIIDKVKDKWRDIGICTGQSDDVETIKTKNMLNNKDACVEVFAVWINKGGHPPKYPLTWQGLYDLLCDVGHRGIANTVADMKNAQGAGILKKVIEQ